VASVTESEYKSALSDILSLGEFRGDRTGTGTISMFGVNRVYDVSSSFPLMTSKKMYFKSMAHELVWFIKGQTNLQDLHPSVHSWWKDFADEKGELGPIYGKQWRQWETPGGKKIDQLQWLVDEIRRNPTSRRLIVSAWNAADIEDMALPPCHTMFQVYVHEKSRKMDLTLYQRSGDMFLGVPYNIASYSLLLMVLCKLTGYRPGRFIHQIGDAHVYLNHIEQVKKYIKNPSHNMPQVTLSDEIVDLDTLTASMFELKGYECEEPIKAPLAV
jgi:thymidylate synthase